MANRTFTKLGRTALVVAPILFSLTLAACDDGPNPAAPVQMTPPPPPPSSPPPAARSACLSQTIPGTAFTPASLVIPDTLKLDLNTPSGFPNGRELNDPVIDVVLAVILLDLARHPASTFATRPLNPPADNMLQDSFPFLGLANGGQPGPGTGTTFNFRTDPESAYTRVDRMGQPAVATALIGSTRKDAYNDANPSDDAAGTFVGGMDGILEQLTELHTALDDDLTAPPLGLTPCAVP